MIIDSYKLHAFRCPMMNGLACMGAACALWRVIDSGRGYCGAGGAPNLQSVAPPADALAEQGELGRLPRQHGKGSAPRTRG